MKTVIYVFLSLNFILKAGAQSREYIYDNLNRIYSVKTNNSMIGYTYDPNGNRINQSNASASFLPDLQWIGSAIDPSSVASGSEIIVNGSIINAGRSIAGYNRIICWLSTNNTIESVDIALDSLVVNSLAANGTYTITDWQLKVPLGLASGNYFLIFQVDARLNVSESNESNNTFVVPITVNSCTGYNASASTVLPGCGLSNGSITLNATGGQAPYTYSINNGVSFSSANMFGNLSAGTYLCKVADAKGCMVNVSVSLNAASGNLPVPNFSYTISGQTITFTNTTANGGSYSWDFGNNISSNSSSPVYTYPSPGNFNVCLTATNSCGSAQKCVSDIFNTYDAKTWVKVFDGANPADYQTRTLITMHYSKMDNHIYRLFRYIDNNNQYYLFLVKTSKSGKVIWSKRFFGIDESAIPNLFMDGITEVNDGFVLLFRGFSDANGRPSRLIKVNRNGEKVWSKSVAIAPAESADSRAYQGLDYAGLVGSNMLSSRIIQSTRDGRALTKLDADGNVVSERQLIIPEFQFSYYTNARIRIIKGFKAGNLYRLIGTFYNSSYLNDNYVFYIAFDDNWNIVVNKRIRGFLLNFLDDIFKVELLNNGNIGIGNRGDFLNSPEYFEIDLNGNLVRHRYSDVGVGIIGVNSQGRYIFSGNNNQRIDIANNNWTPFRSFMLPKSSFVNSGTFHNILVDDSTILSSFWTADNRSGLVARNSLGLTGLCADSILTPVFSNLTGNGPRSENGSISFTSLSQHNSTSSGDVNVMDYYFEGNDFCSLNPCNVTASFSADKNAYCLGDQAIFSNTSMGGASIQWKVNNADGGNSNSLNYTFSSPGQYVVQLIATIGNCKDTLSRIYQVNSGINIAAEVRSAICNQANGALQILPTGGTQPYSFAIEDGDYVNMNSFSGLAPAEYTVKVRDANGCLVTSEVLVQKDAGAIQVKMDVVPVNCNNPYSGSLSGLVLNAVSPYKIVWSTGDTMSTINNLSAGGYSLAVTDANGCTFNQTYQLSSVGAATHIQSAVARGFWSNPATWVGGRVPGICDSVTISAGQVVEMDVDTTVRALFVASGGALLVNSPGKVLNVGSPLYANANCITSGTINISFGTLKVNGRLRATAGSVFTMSGGNFILDGNSGTAQTSVPNGVHLFEAQSSMASFAVFGGVFNIVDPPFGASSQAISCAYNFGDNSTIKFGDGLSTTPGNNPNGFGGNLLPARIGRLILDAKTTLGNRHFINLNPISAKSPVQIISGELIQKARFEVRL